MLIALHLVNFKDQVQSFIKSMNSTKLISTTSNFVGLLWSIPQKKFAFHSLLKSMKHNILEVSLLQIITKISRQILKKNC